MAVQLYSKRPPDSLLRVIACCLIDVAVSPLGFAPSISKQSQPVDESWPAGYRLERSDQGKKNAGGPCFARPPSPLRSSFRHRRLILSSFSTREPKGGNIRILSLGPTNYGDNSPSMRSASLPGISYGCYGCCLVVLFVRRSHCPASHGQVHPTCYRRGCRHYNRRQCRSGTVHEHRWSQASQHWYQCSY